MPWRFHLLYYYELNFKAKKTGAGISSCPGVFSHVEDGYSDPGADSGAYQCAGPARD